jgi:hypothetical protein
MTENGNGENEAPIAHGLADALAHATKDALAMVPADAEIVGLRVSLAFVEDEKCPNQLTAVGGTVAKGGWDLDHIARLFAIHSQSVCRHQQQHAGTLVRGRPRRPPRRRPT